MVYEQPYFQQLFLRASKQDTLDIMVRGQARKLGVEYSGENKYLNHALKYENENPSAFAMFAAAHDRLNRLKEKERELLRPSDIFE